MLLTAQIRTKLTRGWRRIGGCGLARSSACQGVASKRPFRDTAQASPAASTTTSSRPLLPFPHAPPRMYFQLDRLGGGWGVGLRDWRLRGSRMRISRKCWRRKPPTRGAHTSRTWLERERALGLRRPGVVGLGGAGVGGGSGLLLLVSCCVCLMRSLRPLLGEAVLGSIS